MNWHLLPENEVARLLNTTPSGISNAKAEQALREHGKNTIQEQKKRTVWRMALAQLTDFMILILIAAAIISGLLGDLTDTIVILCIVVLNGIVGFVQEYNAEKAMDALKNMAAGQARVVRDGETIELPAAELTPGDVVLLETGNIIPADVRFIDVHQLRIDESTLTGESLNIEKETGALPDGDYTLGDRLNMGYKGTYVTNGRAAAYVVATGMNTELGHIAQLTLTATPATPLQKKLEGFGKRLAIITIGVCGVVFVAGYLRGEPLLSMALTAISLAVAGIPEALPALVTVALALGGKRLANSNALVRKLHAVETLGSVTYICSDKTGTLTENKMTVEELFELEAAVPGLEGKGALLTAMALNNDVTIDADGKWLGESTETALAQYAVKEGLLRTKLEVQYPRIGELPFDAVRKSMTTLHTTPYGVLAITKGAMDVLLQKLTAGAVTAEPERLVNEMAAKGYRVLGYACRMLPALPDQLDAAIIETDLQLIGFAGMIDPPREEAKQAIAQCRHAGITPVMITGDHILTARAIAKALGIITADDDMALTGAELANLSKPAFAKIVEKVRVYARVSPEQKLQIIQALQAHGHFVAMTGDGVNDAPALKNADIGIAMGINGTEVSREAAHMILLDDNYATIVVAIKHGRRIFDNILKFIRFIMTGNSGEIWTILLAPFLGLPIPLLAIQILWINLVSDGLPALALAYEPAEANVMARPPRKTGENIFAGGMGIHILWVGLLIAAVTLGTQAWAIHAGNPHWQTMALNVLCISQMGHIMAIRSGRHSVFSAGLFTNKPLVGALLLTFALQLAIIYLPLLNAVFKTHPLTFKEIAITVAISSIVFWAVELEKWIKRRAAKRHAHKKTI